MTREEYRRGAGLARQRQKAARDFCKARLSEVRRPEESIKNVLRKTLEFIKVLCYSK